MELSKFQFGHTRQHARHLFASAPPTHINLSENDLAIPSTAALTAIVIKWQWTIITPGIQHLYFPYVYSANTRAPFALLHTERDTCTTGKGTKPRPSIIQQSPNVFTHTHTHTHKQRHNQSPLVTRPNHLLNRRSQAKLKISHTFTHTAYIWIKFRLIIWT